MLCFIPFLVFLFLGYRNLISFDRLVKFEYTYYQECWKKDGCPYGFFWKPPHTGWITFSVTPYVARDNCALLWLFVTPTWMKKDADANRLVSQLRLSWKLAIFVGLPLFVFLEILLLEISQS